MKIVLVTKNPPFYENTLDRKSYIKIINKNIILDDIDNMKETQNNYFSNYFTVDENLISDKFNLTVEDMFTRTTYIEPKNYPFNSYSNNFDFWNNVSYAKIIYDNGFTEFCYISARRCVNISINKWYFTFTVDTWNTYWIDTYNQITKLSNYPILITRGHFDRFDYNNSNKLFSFKFITSQNNAFWNNEQFESSITSKLSTNFNITYTPYTEPNNNIIPQANFLNNIYNNYRTDRPPFFDVSGKGYPLVYLNHSDNEIESWIILSTIYGVSNSYWLLPAVNIDVLNPDYSINGTNYPYYKSAFESENVSNTFIWEVNLRTQFINNTSLASYILTPKPTLKFNSGGSYNTYKYEDVCYPIRLRDNYIFNLGQDIKFDGFKQQINLTTPPKNGVVFATSRFNYNLPLRIPKDWSENSVSNMMNTLCDERIDISDTPIIDWFRIYDLSLQNLIAPTILENEPKLFEENLFNIEYSRYGQGSISISPKWYFYGNQLDILLYKSIFLLGYQFVQPHICILTTGPVSGLYKFANLDGSKNLVSQFSSQQQTVTDAEKEFLISNRSQLNTGLNNQLRTNKQGFINSVVGGISGVVGGALGGFALGGPAGAAAGVIGGLYNGTMGIANNRIQAQNAQDMYNAKLQDLANTPNATSDNSSESTYKTLNTYDGYWRLNWINDIDKYKILAFHQQQGYFLNKFVTLYPSSGEGINSFATRQFYNFWQIPEFKLLIQTSNIAPEYQQYFQTLFSNSGVTLWHTYVWNNITYDIVGDYSHENWELSLTGFMGD